MRHWWILIVLGFALGAGAQPWIGRISVKDPQEVDWLASQGFAVYHGEFPGIVDLLLTDDDVARLQHLGYDITALSPYQPPAEVDSIYHSYEELTEELQFLASQYPGICRLDSIGRGMAFPRTIWCMKLSDNAILEEDEPSVYYMGVHHACELMGLETLLYMIQHFLDSYGSDSTITAWMNQYEIFFVPLVNPDGHHAVTSEIFEIWRKNARDLNRNGIYYEFIPGSPTTNVHEGVDLNRNYDWNWNWSASPDPHNWGYKGPEPFSESELQAIRNLALQQHFVCGLSIHSYGEGVIYPWDNFGLPAPDQPVINAIAQGLADSFLKDNGEPYTHNPISAAMSMCVNWFYGFAGTLSYLVETNPSDMYIPPGSQVLERAERYMNGAVYLLERMNGPGITGHVRDANTGQPLPAQVEIIETLSAEVRSRFAEARYGRFTRLLNPGTYWLYVALPGYQPQTIPNIVVTDTMTCLEVELQPANGSSADLVPLHRDSQHWRVRQSDGHTILLNLSLTEAARVKLNLYDLLGRDLGEVFVGFLNAGEHSISIPSSRLSSGVYFIAGTYADFALMQKIVIIR